MDVPGPVTDPRAGALRQRHQERFPASPRLPVPVESIAEDLLGLAVGERDIEVSGMLLPAERQIWLNASESPARQRFTLAHELGHWVCQHLEGRTVPVFCRATEVGVDEGRLLEREANVSPRSCSCPRTRCGRRPGTARRRAASA